MKTCKRCGEEKPASAFSKNRGSKDGLHSYCKPCNKVATEAWRAANKDRVKATTAAWKEANREKVKSAHAAWRSANPEKCRGYAVARYEANKEKVLAANAAWQKANPDKVRAYKAAWVKANYEKVKEKTRAREAANPERARNRARIKAHNYRARKRENGGELSTRLAERLFALQKGKCACGCKQPLGDDYHLDHILPLALGGTNTDDNIQLLRATCNKRKSAKHPIDFMQQKGFLL